ncbi:similar to Saccharomyces cerevisiae YBR136W MEC1 Genome integrity checkpoint protein and PI kinase superfamily member [Maudiozyma barnettii]|uniref:Serine/threonine-protein kinase MEC1 n=1 Tax=Maudiozyma barnettii TaxID=61262 RepID=A0A8H2VAX4_9SACH|nr:protein kinase MEC1 [Kazachstania barnettii]CAB4251907.1 similar to Saccharomyces cerevisiae YBR136W MEC1 Genome integrity checkpoint protein and PI kinase superfamily member [Kazachstania barnettii]CAD1778235.1 similar to Saccharomyces cerevisiae YBR136W MEC1 Genome integrity checkpoint protein and PI kinase superfamily member [Kazachstania barnettii]
MESRIKYLDELSVVLLRSKVSKLKDQNIAPKVPEDGDPNSCELIKFLVKNLLDSQKGEVFKSTTIFSKSMQVLDLVITTNPYLLIHTSLDIVPSDNQKQSIGILSLIEIFIEISVLNIDRQDRLWFIRRKLGNWCQLVTDIYGSHYKLIQSYFFETTLDKYEKKLRTVRYGNYPYQYYLRNLQVIYVLCYLLNAKHSITKSTFLFIDSNKGTNSWNIKFQKLMRVVLFILDSVQIEPNIDYIELQLKFISLTVEQLFTSTIPSIQGTPRIISTDQFKFTLTMINQFMKSNIVTDCSDSITFAKCLLRVYSLCIPRGSRHDLTKQFFDLLQNELSLEQWIRDYESHFTSNENNPEDTSTNPTWRSVILVYLDIQRRSVSSKSRMFDEHNNIWLTNTFPDKFVKYVLQPFTDSSKQLENLRILILTSYLKQEHPGLLSTELFSLERSLLSSQNNSLRFLFNKISESITACFTINNNKKLVSWVRILGRLACYEHYHGDSNGLDNWEFCKLCEGNNRANIFKNISPNRPDCTKHSLTYVVIQKNFLSNPNLNDFNEALLTGLLFCLQRIFTHFQPPALVDQLTSKFQPEFELVSKCFRSQNRYLRIIATRLVPLWNITCIHNSNLEITAELIKFLQSQKKDVMSETLAMAWVQLTLTTSGQEFDSVLFKLIFNLASEDYSTYLMIGFQIKNMARLLRKTPYQLLSPILPDLLRQVGKGVIPMTPFLTRLVNLSGVSLISIFNSFQRYIVPHAVMQQGTDVLGKIATIMCGNEAESINEKKEELLKNNISEIFAVCLVKNKLFSSEIIEKIFTTRVHTFDKSMIYRGLPNFVTLAEITKLYRFSETEDENAIENQNMVLCSLRFLMTNFKKDYCHGSKYKNVNAWTETQESAFQKKMSQDILGIFQVFSLDIHNVEKDNSDKDDIERKSNYYEKLRVIHGVSFLIEQCRQDVIISALPQINICLQIALEIEEVRYSALRCWLLLVQKLPDDQLSTVIDGLIVFILQKWNIFNTQQQTLVYKILDYLITDKIDLMFENNPYIVFALKEKTELKLLDRDTSFARRVGKTRGIQDLLPIFVNNLSSNNRYMIKQTLEDIKLFLKRKQTNSTNQVFSMDNNKPNISQLLTTLLKTAHKFRTLNPTISRTCSECISIIGVLDSTTHDNSMTVSSEQTFDFSDRSQTIKFLIWVLNDFLVPSFWDSENPNKQLFVALVMQKSLDYCGLSSKFWDINKKDSFQEEFRLWSKFNKTAQATLSPLLSSLYFSSSTKSYVDLDYPFFDMKMSYQKWVTSLTLDLITVGTEEQHPLHIFASLMRWDDGSFSNFILPYIVMDILINAGENEKCEKLVGNLSLEFSHIFKLDSHDLNHLQIDSRKMCFAAIFRVLEYCRKWVTQYKFNYSQLHGTYIVTDQKITVLLQRIDKFLNSVPLSLLAKGSIKANSYERSALYLEQCYRQQDINETNNEMLLKDLRQSYEEIGDIDSIDGMLKTFPSHDFHSKIEELRYSDNWSIAQDCFSVLSNFDNPQATTRMLKSMHDHQLYSKLLANVSSIKPSNKSFFESMTNDCYNYGLEASNLLGNIDSLKFWIQKVESLGSINDPSILFQYNMAKALSHVSVGNVHMTSNYINRCYQVIGTHFTTSAATSTLVEKQKLLTKLHGLYDVNLLASDNNEIQYKQNTTLLNTRMERVGVEFTTNHYLLSIRKSFNLLRNPEHDREDLVETFYKITTLARNNSRLDIAIDALMSCLHYGHPHAELEFAEVLWKQGENDRALKLVKEIHKKNQSNRQINKHDKAKVLLKYTEWLYISNNSSSDLIIKQYRTILRLDSTWYKPYYSFGLYYSKFLEKKKADGFIPDGKLESQSIAFFLKAFERNTIQARENLPKVVTFWLDTAERSQTPHLTEAEKVTLGSMKKSKSKDPKEYMEKFLAERMIVLKRTTDDICNHVSDAIDKCPTYIWYSVLTQLLSRLLHVHSKTAKLIKKILLKLTIEYPTHILWYICVLQNSTINGRVQCGTEILEAYLSQSPTSKGLISNVQKLTRSLTRVSMKKAPDNETRAGRSLENDFKFDMRMAPSDMTVPARINLETISPVSAESMSTYKPFRNDVTIAQFGSGYKVFTSLKKPKKINIIGSDGKTYGLMCKMEDVRQDNQYMQFATTMDFLLKKEVESTKRDLGITTYSVLSLTEECGILEFIPNVVTLRSIYTTQYQIREIKYNMRSFHEQWSHCGDTQKAAFFQEQLRRFPPVLHEWFLQTFPDPISWYNARNTYSRSYAVMSMLGYILGLGDRHCENILLDTETGKVLHVDFDCLFDKGKTLPCPEIVPFRLTQNVHDALGIIGTEGTFKKSSEVTLSLVRHNEIALMNVIETIVYDRDVAHQAELQEALKILQNKIRGIDPRDGLILSVAGQVDTLICEARSTESLSKMYIGWLPFW